MIFSDKVITGINFDGLMVGTTVKHLGSNIGVHIPRLMTVGESDVTINTTVSTGIIINSDPSFVGKGIPVRNYIIARPLHIIDKSEHENLPFNVWHDRSIDKPYIDDSKPWYNEKVLIFFMDGDPKQCYYTDYKLSSGRGDVSV